MYDIDTPEYTVIINDWLTELSINKFAHHYLADGDNKPASMLINGTIFGIFFYTRHLNRVKNYNTITQQHNKTKHVFFNCRQALVSYFYFNIPYNITVLF